MKSTFNSDEAGSGSATERLGVKPLYLGVFVIGLVAWFATLAGTAAFAAEPATRPNIVFVLVDDLRWDDLSITGSTVAKTPHLDRVAREGVLFRNAFATTVICSPSRANILTGLQTRAHGIIDNTDRSAASHKLATFPMALQKAGYETAFVGKWHMGNDDSRRPGFDHWVCLKGQGTTFDPELNVNGQSVNAKGYVTDILGERAVEFLKAKHAKPFLLYYSHKAVHPETVQRADGSLSDPTLSNFIPADRHKTLYAGAKITRRPNALAAPEGKPCAWPTKALRRMGRRDFGFFRKVSSFWIFPGLRRSWAVAESRSGRQERRTTDWSSPPAPNHNPL